MISNEDFETLAARVAEPFEDGGSRARTSKTRSGGPQEVVVFNTNVPVSAVSWQGQSTSSTNV